MSSTINPVTLSFDGPIAHMHFNRPDCLNAINVAVAEGILDAAIKISEHKETRVIVLSGAGRSFMAGGDLAAFRDAGSAASDVALEILAPMNKALQILAELPQPIIASIQGPVAGAGMSIALFADLVVAADTTVFNSAYINVANNCDCSGSWSIPRLVGTRKAMEILLLSDTIDAEQALAMNLVNQVVSEGELASATDKLARKLASKAPLAVASTKALVRNSLDNSLNQQLALEQNYFIQNASSNDFQEALAAFFEKRKPEFTGQ